MRKQNKTNEEKRNENETQKKNNARSISCSFNKCDAYLNDIFTITINIFFSITWNIHEQLTDPTLSTNQVHSYFLFRSVRVANCTSFFFSVAENCLSFVFPSPFFYLEFIFATTKLHSRRWGVR